MWDNFFFFFKVNGSCIERVLSLNSSVLVHELASCFTFLLPHEETTTGEALKLVTSSLSAD